MLMAIRPIKPEIMSPVGYWPQLYAAIEAGADAVYFGLKHFTARAKVGFALSELPEVMHTLHLRGVKGYVTFNTLVFDHELGEAARSLAAIAETDVDAIIVQDIGIARFARRLAPDLEVHGSTQMSITSAEGVRLAQQLGVSRVVLARELSLADVRAIRAETDCELEMFVHGALCVSYSGQCFSSEAWGGRSANRGQCAQACRLPYELIVDQQLRPLGDARYLLSPGDLFALHQVPEIMQLGISALKIEGRYKSEEYVALTTRAYRKAVDDAWAGLPLSVTRTEELQLEQVYSRGLGPFFIAGTNHQTVVNGRAPRHRGVLAGRVTRVYPDGVQVAPVETIAEAPLKPGDGVVFDAADWRSPEEHEEGGRIYELFALVRGEQELRFANGALDTTRIRVGDLVWRSHDPDLDKAARPYLNPSAPVQRQPVLAHVLAYEGEPLQITWSLVQQPAVQVETYSASPLGEAQNRAVSTDYLRAQLGRLGGTVYELAGLDLDMRGQPFVPSSLLNQLRREAVSLLTEIQGNPRSVIVHDPETTLADELRGAASRIAVTPGIAAAPGIADFSPPPASLHVLVRTPEQLEAAIVMRPASITLDYLELYGLRPAVEQILAAGIVARVASPRVLKPSEQRIVRFLLKLGCPIVVRSGGLLQALQEEPECPELIGDFSLNAANLLATNLLLNMGLQRVTPTHDLNAAQIVGLAEGVGAARIEVIAYQHLPVFHTEHCVFCRFLSEGTSYKDCGHPCEQHRVALRDQHGREHPVMADVGCRNTVFGAEAQEASGYLDEWRLAGIQHYRIEFVHERADEVTQVLRAFQTALGGPFQGQELGKQLKRIAAHGTTTGSLFVPEGYLSIPLMQ